MHIAFLLIGGNEGNRENYLKQTRERLAANCGQLLAASSVYETAAWGVTQQRNFYNQALKIATSVDAETLLTLVLTIEKSLGRIRNQRYGPRTIDIDIIFFDNEIIKAPHLTVPHPEVQNRRFALECMAEIAPNLVHPVLHKTIGQLLAECTDMLTVYKLPAVTNK